MHERTGASFISGPLYMSAPGPSPNRGPYAGVHLGLIEFVAPMHERTGATSKHMPLHGNTPGPY